ncbi:MAG: DUF4910 domain-containing protein [Promethearchaeota archaeon]
MNIKQLITIFTDEVSPHSIMNTISGISQFNRVQGSNGYFKATHYIQSILKENGIETSLHEFPADGKLKSWDWIAPMSWDISSGECWITKPVKKRICRFIDIPMSVITHSKSIDFEAPLIDIGKGDNVADYRKANGKIALITASPRTVFPLASKYGVKGLILYPDSEKATKIGKNTVQYDGFWPSAENLTDVISGFSISHRQALELKEHLEKDKEVLVRFKIDAQFSKGKLYVLETKITGSERPLEEIILISHLCHPSPSANDNASGSATLVELVSVLNRMIELGILSTPKRTLRFLWVPEFFGTVQWLKKHEDYYSKRKIITILNLDMVGETDTPLKISCPSITTPTFLRAILKYAAECVSNQKLEDRINGRDYFFNYRIVPFEGGSDHLIFNDRYFSIPSIMLSHEDPFHHSNADNIDKVDPLECRSVCTIAGSVAYGLTMIDIQFLKEVLSHVFLEGMNDAIRYEHSLNNQNELLEIQKLKQLELFEKIILKRIESIFSLDPESSLKEKISQYSELISNYFHPLHKQLRLNSKGEKQEEIGKMIIKRNYEGPTPYTRLIRHRRSDFKQLKLLALSKEYLGGIILELFNLADGNSCIEDIFLLLKIEYPQVTYGDVIFLAKLFQEEGMLSGGEFSYELHL